MNTPANISHPRRIKTFVRRAGRSTIAQTKALAEHGAQVLIPYQASALDFIAAFADKTRAESRNDTKPRPTILEIGFGMGEATAHIASVRPELNFLCVEVHEAGVGALVKRCVDMHLPNVRIIAHDAVEVLEHMIAPGSLEGLHLFFPDPWHKLRHNKRRMVQPPWVQQLCTRLKPGAIVHMATDWQPYAEQMLQVLSAEPALKNTSTRPDGYCDKPWYRPLTKFENRGIRLGHGVWDLVFERL